MSAVVEVTSVQPTSEEAHRAAARRLDIARRRCALSGAGIGRHGARAVPDPARPSPSANRTMRAAATALPRSPRLRLDPVRPTGGMMV